MPEMPEVTTVAKYINKDAQNKTILDADFLISKMVRNMSPAALANALKKKKINAVSNVGKHLIFDLSDNLFLVSHLRMEGKYRFAKDLHLQKHDHAWFKLETGYLIFADTRKFATFDLIAQDKMFQTSPWKDLGFLAEDIDSEYFFNKIKHKSLAIKSILLDQTLIIGLGNIYVDEVLWTTKIHPTLPGNKVSLKQAQAILVATEDILRRATAKEGSTIKSYKAYNKMEGSFQEFLQVHTKVNKPCSRCQSIIQKIKVNGRGTYFCPTCQK